MTKWIRSDGLMRLPREDSEGLHLRWAVWLMIVASAATMVARIATVRATTGETPMLSANDRSRWCTVRALVDEGTYAIDSLVQIRHPETKRRFWKTIDMVRHRGPDGREHYYSSKPPLFPTLVAGQYWLIQQVTGATLEHHPFPVMRWILVVTNVLPLLLYFYVLQRWIFQVATTGAAVLFAMAAATWGTLLTNFAVTLNNHLPAAICVLLASAGMLRIWNGETRWWYFAGTGFFSAFAAANELPALALFACIALAVAWRRPREAVLAFLPAAMLVAGAFFVTNYLAHGTWVPAYAHRGDGPVVGRVDVTAADELDRQVLPLAVREELERAGVRLSEQAKVVIATAGQRWGIWDRVGARRFAVVVAPDGLVIREWTNWYDYEGSYWITARQGVDRGEPSIAVYAWHAIGGHHGIFSLTPIWFLSVWGAWLMLRSPTSSARLFAVIVIGVTLVCLAFYLTRPLIDRNYGGVSCGFRWMFWFTPLWLICLVPAADRLLARRMGRAAALLLLAISVFSAAFAAANPWTHPWLWQWGALAGWWDP
ncbi:MAG: hypothetical protein ACYC0X_26735 [Pirellulaceae bacterium]